MALGLLAGVGIAEFYDFNNNLIVSSPTLIDSAINLTITSEEARGGQGNALLGRYYHTSGFGLTLTDQVWNINYLAFNCGGAITAGAEVMSQEEVVTTVANQITVTGVPTNFTATSGIIGWYKLQTEDDSQYRKIDFIGSVSTVANLPVGSRVCVKYPIVSDSARKFRINTQFIPSIVHARLTFNLFKSGSTQSQIENDSSKIGEIIVDVPQFQFDGNITLSLSSTTIASVPLTGQALANYTGTCDGSAWYAEIIENIRGLSEFANVTDIAVAGGDITLGDGEVATLEVYKLYNDGTNASLIKNSKLTFTAEAGKTGSFTVTADGIITGGDTAGTGYIQVLVTENPELSTALIVTATGV